MNPVDLDTQFLGVYRRDLSRMFAEVLQALRKKTGGCVKWSRFHG